MLQTNMNKKSWTDMNAVAQLQAMRANVLGGFAPLDWYYAHDIHVRGQQKYRLLVSLPPSFATHLPRR